MHILIFHFSEGSNYSINITLNMSALQAFRSTLPLFLGNRLQGHMQKQACLQYGFAHPQVCFQGNSARTHLGLLKCLTFDP